MGQRKKRRRRKITLSEGEFTCGQEIQLLGVTPQGQYVIPVLPKLRYDYYFTYQDKHYLLEFDGEQHFKRSTYFHRRKGAFEKQCQRDFLKTVVAILQGYTIIRIAYRDIRQCSRILENAIQSKERLFLSTPEMYSYLLREKIPLIWIKKYSLPELRDILQEESSQGDSIPLYG